MTAVEVSRATCVLFTFYADYTMMITFNAKFQSFTTLALNIVRRTIQRVYAMCDTTSIQRRTRGLWIVLSLVQRHSILDGDATLRTPVNLKQGYVYRCANHPRVEKDVFTQPLHLSPPQRK